MVTKSLELLHYLWDPTPQPPAGGKQAMSQFFLSREPPLHRISQQKPFKLSRERHQFWQRVYLIFSLNLSKDQGCLGQEPFGVSWSIWNSPSALGICLIYSSRGLKTCHHRLRGIIEHQEEQYRCSCKLNWIQTLVNNKANFGSSPANVAFIPSVFIWVS